MSDWYASNADLYAAVSLPGLEAQLAGLRSVVSAPLAGPVVEVAAGIGTALSTLADLTPWRLYAVEPSAHMRVGLMTTVAGDATLRPRVTVLPGTLGQVVDRVPARLGGIVVLNALGHFDVEERAELWALAARRLVPGGQMVLGLQPPFEPVEIPWSDFGSVRVGSLTYHTAGTASITSDHMAEWTMRWTVRDESGVEVERREASTRWAVVGPEDVARSASAAGLELFGEALDGTMLCYRQSTDPP